MYGLAALLDCNSHVSQCWDFCLSPGETPGISVGDIAKAIGGMWRGLSEEEKKPFQVKTGCVRGPLLEGW